MSWDPEMIAAHELGHLVVLKNQGHDSEGIRLMTSWWSGDVVAGYCDLRGFMHPTPGDNPEPGGWDLYRGMLVMTAAGQAASEHWFQLHGEPVQFTAGSDYAMFVEDAVLMPNAPSWDQAKEEARQIIVPRWDEIVELIPGLIENRRLSGGKVA
jgi:hypothetical protein